LYSFIGSSDGDQPHAGLVQGSDGNFYGTSSRGGYINVGDGYGAVFKISPNGVLTSLYLLSLTDGAWPDAALVQGRDGYFYGTTWAGTTTNCPIMLGYGDGTVFKISTNGALTTLCSFTCGNAGAQPSAALVQGSDGYFYGTTSDAWISGFGTVFKISPNGVLTTLYAFGTVTNEYGQPLDGWGPEAALVQGTDGYFYGTTAGGGKNGSGTVFRLTIVLDPQLTIIRSGPYVILTWPTDYAGFSYAGYALQSTTNLGSSAVWSTNSSPPVVIGGQNVVINAISGRQQFYRLSH
jgi:uncharacterized repeat protein (TIGR03803 family)